MKYSFKIVVIAVIITSCSNNPKQKISEVNPMDQAKWIIGQWESKSPEGHMYESWKKENDSLYTGKSYFVSGTDTSFSETMRLEKRGHQVFFIPTVKDQNSEQPVDFALMSFTENELIFENPKHDFPQKISYNHIGKDSLVAEISGKLKGKDHSEKFPMKKIK